MHHFAQRLFPPRLTKAQQRFVAAQDFEPVAAEQLPGDASARRYIRLHGKTGTRLLMQVEPGAADFEPFIRIARHLRSLGLSAPAIEAADAKAGLALIEDFGTETFTNLLKRGADERLLYELAIDTLTALHEAPTATAVAAPAYDMTLLFEELEMFTDWYAPAVEPGLDAAGFRREFLALWAEALSGIVKVRDALVLRDFHVDNLMVLSDRQGPAACGLLDFQDACLGSPAYDLVSLTQDARRDLSKGLEDTLVKRYLKARPGIDPNALIRDYRLLAAHRHTKIAGNFERLARRDGKHGYRVHLPRVLRQLEEALSMAGLDPIRQFMDRQLPAWRTPPGAPPYQAKGPDNVRS